MALIQDAINEIMDLVGALSGMKAAPDYPPEDASVFPFAIAYEGAGSWEFGAAGGNYGEKKALLSVVVEVHVARVDLPRDAQKAVFYSDAVPNAIMKGVRNNLLNNTIDAMGNIETSGLIAMAYGSKEINTLGYRFICKNIKIRSDIA